MQRLATNIATLKLIHEMTHGGGTPKEIAIVAGTIILGTALKRGAYELWRYKRDLKQGKRP